MFNAGDVVRLASGGPEMTVFCVWGADGKTTGLDLAWFEAGTLHKWEHAPPFGLDIVRNAPKAEANKSEAERDIERLPGTLLYLVRAANLLAEMRGGVPIAIVSDHGHGWHRMCQYACELTFTGAEFDVTTETFRFPNGSTVFRSQPSGLEGVNLHAIFIDNYGEITPEEMQMLRGRARISTTDASGRECPPVVIVAGA